MKSDLENYKKDYDFEFKMEGVSKPYFRLKFPYYDGEIGCEVVAMFDNEMEVKGGVYIELTDNNFNRVGGPQLYYLEYHGDYATRFKEKNSATGKRYLVPTSELTNITLKWKSENQMQLPLDGGAGNDCSIKDITGRDLCAIIWRKPLSEKDWLNRLIVKNNETTKAKSTRK